MIKAAFVTCLTSVCALLLSGAAVAQSMEKVRAVYADGRFVVLVENRHRVMSCTVEQIRHFGGEVFVQLESHLNLFLLG